MKDFAGRGFEHLRGFFALDKIEAFESQLAALYLMQAMKIGEYREFLGEAEFSSPRDMITKICDLMEGRDKQALYQVQKFLPSCQQLRGLFDARFMAMGAEALGSDQRHLLLDGPALFVSRPNSERLLYKWHSEAHYYPKRRRFLNVWFPIFTDRTVENGAMSFVPGSHARHWEFAEYTGYNKDTEGKAAHFVQYEIPENFFSDLTDRYTCTSERGDLILFNRNLIHRSNHNASQSYSFAIVARLWDPSSDLTLSGSLAATPYGGDVGRSDLIVTP